VELREARVEVRRKLLIVWQEVCPRRHRVLDASQIQLLGLPANQASTGAPSPFGEGLEVSRTEKAQKGLQSATQMPSQLD